jgi:hypothetical protein
MALKGDKMPNRLFPAAILLAALATSTAADSPPAQVMALPFAVDDTSPAGSAPGLSYVAVGVLAVLLIGAALQIESSQRKLRDFDPDETE